MNKYKMNIKELSNITSYTKIQTTNDDCKTERVNKIVQLLQQDQIITSSEVSNCLFPIKKYKLFISHHHCSINEVEKLIYKLSNEAYINQDNIFVDYKIWPYYIDIVKKITNNNEQNLIRMLEQLNYILQESLEKAINSSQNFLYLYNDNTIKQTSSPWVYHEIKYANNISKKIINNEALTTEAIKFDLSTNSFNEVDLTQLISELKQ